MTTMKHLYYTLLLAGMAMLVTSCGKDEPTGPKDPDPTDPTEMYVKELRHALFAVRDADQVGPALVQLLLIRSNQGTTPFGTTVKAETSSATPLVFYDLYSDPLVPVTSGPIEWSVYPGFTEQYESGATINVVPVEGSYDFVLTVVSETDKIIYYNSTQPLRLKMWQENGKWKAELTKQ